MLKSLQLEELEKEKEYKIHASFDSGLMEEYSNTYCKILTSYAYDDYHPRAVIEMKEDKERYNIEEWEIAEKKISFRYKL